jgi:hypothetical protein
MDFSLSEEQELLQHTVRGFVEKECPPQKVRAIFDGERQEAPALWKGLAEIGVAGLVVPESHGGAGLELLELALVAEELGRGVVPVPFLGHALATLALARGGSEAQRAKWLPRLASGEARSTVALAEAGARWLPGSGPSSGPVIGSAARRCWCPRPRARSSSWWAAAEASWRWWRPAPAYASRPSRRSTAAARSPRSPSTARPARSWPEAGPSA